MNLPAHDLPERLSQKEFAALLGISPPMVTKHKAAGRLAMDGRLVMVRESIERIAAWKDPARGGDRTPGVKRDAGAGAAPGAAAAGSDADRLNYNAQAAREKLAAAQLRELELAREAGALVLKKERDDAEFTRARAAREAILSIPDRLAARIVAAESTTAVHAMLLDECRRVCNLMAAMPDHAPGADAGADAGAAA